MGSKKKRKSMGPLEEQTPKRPGSQQGRRSAGGGGSGALAWGLDGVTATLLSHQAVVFVGRARLAVQSGEVAVFGSTVTPGSGCIELAADERSGGALLLEPGAAPGRVPLMGLGAAAVFTLARSAGSGGGVGRAASALPSAAGGATLAERGSGVGAASTREGEQQQQQQQQQQGHHRVGFGAWLASDPAAPAAPPPLPPLWQQAAGEVGATLAHHCQQQQQQGGCAAAAAGGPAPPVIVVCGAKKVGKSTFCRLLVNSLLSQHPCVAFLDADCGQPEFTAPGLVSLNLLRSPVLGPPHMHQQRPSAAFFVGDVSPANDPVRYLQYIRELYGWHCQHGAAVVAGHGGAAAAAAAASGQGPAVLPPLVVNTHGWVKGMGYDILVEMLQGLPVSHLVQIASSNPKKNLPPGAFWLPQPGGDTSAGGSGTSSVCQEYPQPLQWLLPGLGDEQAAAQPAVSDTSARSAATYGTVPAASDVTGAAGGPGGGVAAAGAGMRGRMHAVEQRALQWEALAQQCVDASGTAAVRGAPAGGSDGSGGSRRGDPAAAAAAAAAAASEDLGDRLAAAVPYEVDAADVEVQVLHSSVPASQLFYALNGAVVGLCAQPAAQQQQQQQQPAAASLPCLGLGIVRAADAAARRLYLLTAVPEDELAGVRVLQLGRLELPASLLQTGSHMSAYLALHSLSSAGTGAGAIKSRNNLLRQSQM